MLPLKTIVIRVRLLFDEYAGAGEKVGYSPGCVAVHLSALVTRMFAIRESAPVNDKLTMAVSVTGAGYFLSATVYKKSKSAYILTTGKDRGVVLIFATTMRMKQAVEVAVSF